MATDADFLVGEELEDIFDLLDGGFLDDDDVIAAEINSIEAEVAVQDTLNVGFTCESCQKVCKSRRGLTRHIRAKHQIQDKEDASNSVSNVSTVENQDEITWKKLHPLLFKKMLVACAEKLSKDECYPESFRSTFANFKITNEENKELYDKVKPCIGSYGDNHDAEGFYSSLYQLFLENLMPSKFSDSYISNTLLTEVGNAMLEHLSGKSVIEPEVKSSDTKPLSDKERLSLQYLAGFVVNKLFRKFNFRKGKPSNPLYEQYAEILKACKSDDDMTQTLIVLKDRGGLWKVNDRTQNIFLHCENIFRRVTAKFTVKIVCEDLVKEVVANCSVLSYFDDICNSTGLTIDKESQKDLIEHMTTLYFRVRTFSFAKSVRERFKAAKKKTKSQALRRSIKIASSSTELGH